MGMYGSQNAKFVATLWWSSLIFQRANRGHCYDFYDHYRSNVIDIFECLCVCVSPPALVSSLSAGLSSLASVGNTDQYRSHGVSL